MNEPEKRERTATNTTMSETTDATTDAENSATEYGRERTIYGNRLGVNPEDVPRKTDLQPSDFEGGDVSFGWGGQIADSTVKKTVIRDFYDFGESWETVKAETISTAEKAFHSGAIDRFERNGRETREHFMDTTDREREQLIAYAVGVQFASYRCEEARLASIVRNTEGTGLNAAKQIVRKSPKGGQTFPLLTDMIQSAQHVTLANILVEEGAESARQYAIENISGMSERKAGFWLMLLGFGESFALDVNVRAIITPYVQKVVNIAPDSIDACQKCRNACMNDKNDNPRIDGPSNKIENGWYAEPGIYARNRSYLGYHMIDHVGEHGHGAEQYADLIIRFFRNELDKDLSRRTATQIMFNSGMSFTESASNEAPNRDEKFYTHQYFYDAVL